MTSPSPVSGPKPLLIEDYLSAPSGVGPQAGQWADKPHRLIYDLCSEVEKLRDTVAALEAENAARQALRWPEQIFALEATVSSQQDEIARLRDRFAALQEFADHVEHCVECGEMSVESCSEGSRLKAAAATPGEPSHD